MESSSEEAASEDPYIKTITGNFVSRNADISETRNVEIKGRSWIEEGVVIRGDLARIRMGRYCRISTGTILEPAPATASSQGPHAPVSIGSHTLIGPNCHIRAAAIGSYCWIGSDVRMGPRVIVRDACVIEKGVVLGDDTVIPPFTRVSTVGPLDSSATGEQFSLQMIELPPATIQLLQEESMEAYQAFAAQRSRRTQ
jgi:dynactin-5